MPKLSIIVPIYNGEKFLNKCIDSILEQEYTDFEVILVNDGSSDSSQDICLEYERKDSRVVVFKKENAGLVAARKSGVEIAKGEYIGFVDCDDFIDKNMYSDLMQSVEKHNADIATAGIIIDYINSTNKAYNMFPEGFYDKEAMETQIMPKMLVYSGFLKFGIIPGVVVKVFKKEVVEKALLKVPNNIKMGEDTAITSHSFENANSVCVVNSAAYHYVQGEDSMIRKFSPERFKNICDLYNCVSSIKNEGYKKQLNLYMAYLLFIVVDECIEKSTYNRKEKNKVLKEILLHKMSITVLKNADLSNLSPKDKIKVVLMKYRLISLLTIILKR